MMEKEMLWNDTAEEIAAGCKEAQDVFICVFCGIQYLKGRIYELDGVLFDACGAAHHHVKKEHGYAVDYLLSLHTDILGISEIQQKILRRMSDGKDDKTIAKELGIACSTVRNHRFKLREKLKQAKLFTALMASLEQKTKRPISQSDIGNIEEVHSTASMPDDRYCITEAERDKAVKIYMDEHGYIRRFPTKEKKKIILLREVMKCFAPDREYHEKEVNRILERIHEDYATIRRALIAYQFLSRNADGTIYRVASLEGIFY